MLFTKNAEDWVRDAQVNQNLFGQMSASCGHSVPKHVAGAGQYRVSDTAWVEFHNRYGNSIRAFARRNPSITYMEASLDAPSDFTGKLLEGATCHGPAGDVISAAVDHYH